MVGLGLKFGLGVGIVGIRVRKITVRFRLKGTMQYRSSRNFIHIHQLDVNF